MTTLLQDIRGALQLKAIAVSGFPGASQRAYEGKLFTPTVGVAYAAMTLMTTSRRPFSLNGDTKINAGLFQISLFYPADNKGTAAIEAMADAIADDFAPGADLIQGNARVRTSYAEPGFVLPDAHGLHLPITIGWRVLFP